MKRFQLLRKRGGHWVLSRSRPRPIIGFFLLVLTSSILLFFTLLNALSEHLVAFIVFLPFVAFFAYVLVREFNQALNTSNSYFLFSRPASYDFIATFIGAVLTYLISQGAGTGAVVASGLIGVLAALLVPSYGVPVFCGSFFGMCAHALFGVFPFMIGALIASMVFVVTKDVMNGFGGKLGTIAFTPALFIPLIFEGGFLAGDRYGIQEGAALVVASVLGAVLTYLISIRLTRGPVFASGFIGLLSGLVLPIVFGSFGGTLAVAAFGASFVGMSSPERLKDERFIMLGGLMFGLIFVFSAPYFTGSGGKLGTIAFVSAIMFHGLLLLFPRVKSLKERKGNG